MEWGPLAGMMTTGRGTRVLAVGWGADAFARIAEWLGSEVACLERSWPDPNRVPGLTYPAPATPALPVPLPYDDALFDTVFLSGAVEWSASEADAGTAAAHPLRRLLRECRRVLKPGGMLLVLAENRFSITAFGGQKHASTGLRFFDLFPRFLYPTLPRKLRVRARAHRAYSYRGWHSLLRREGFQVEGCYAPWPSARQWGRITSASAPPANALGGSPDDIRARAAHRLLGAARGLGLAYLLPPNYLLSARVIGEEAHAREHRPLIEEMATAEGERLDDEISVSSYLNSRSWSFAAGRTLFKVALTDEAVLRLKRHASTTALLSGHPIAAYAPLPARLGAVRGVRYLARPLVPCDPTRRASEAQVREILDALRERSVMAPLSDTDFWKRLYEPGVREALESLGASTVLAHCERALCGRAVRTGIVHGDLHIENLLVTPGGVFIIDWEQFEPHSPQFLDVITASGSLRLGPGSTNTQTFLEQMGAIVEERPGLPLRPFLFEQIDELSRSEMVSCYLLWHASAAVELWGSRLIAAEKQLYAQWCTCCERWLGLRHPEQEAAGRTG
jgi:hypothetical protein